MPLVQWRKSVREVQRTTATSVHPGTNSSHGTRSLLAELLIGLQNPVEEPCERSTRRVEASSLVAAAAAASTASSSSSGMSSATKTPTKPTTTSSSSSLSGAGASSFGSGWDEMRPSDALVGGCLAFLLAVLVFGGFLWCTWKKQRDRQTLRERWVARDNYHATTATTPTGLANTTNEDRPGSNQRPSQEPPAHGRPMQPSLQSTPLDQVVIDRFKVPLTAPTQVIQYNGNECLSGMGISG